MYVAYAVGWAAHVFALTAQGWQASRTRRVHNTTDWAGTDPPGGSRTSPCGALVECLYAYGGWLRLQASEVLVIVTPGLLNIVNTAQHRSRERTVCLPTRLGQ